MQQDNSMTSEDLKLNTLYIEDNGWSRLWFYGLRKNKWIIYDPEMSGTMDIVSEINDDGFDEKAPSVEHNSKKILKDMLVSVFTMLE